MANELDNDLDKVKVMEDIKHAQHHDMEKETRVLKCSFTHMEVGRKDSE